MSDSVSKFNEIMEDKKSDTISTTQEALNHNNPHSFGISHETYSGMGITSVNRSENKISEIKSDFREITDSIAGLLEYKNLKYGNAALEPMEIFEGKTKVGQRLDDKLGRVKNSDDLKKNDIADLIGYLTLVCVENGWSNFDEFKD